MAREGDRVVLIAIDGSESANYAFDWYLANMKQPHDYVYGLVVPEYNLSGVTVGPLSDPQALSNEFREQHQVVEKLCSDYTAKLRSAGVKGQVDSYPGGKPGETIVEQAEKLNAQAIVMGTRGLSKIKKFILGSVSNFVVQHATVPVSVIPMKH